jgi:soluble lytic murein transglycosylase
VISRFDHTYYSYRAREKLIALGVPEFDIKDDPVYVQLDTINEGPFAQTPLPLNEEPLPFEPGIDETTATFDAGSVRAYDIKDHFRKYSELMAIGFYDEAANEAKVLVAASPEDKKTSAKLALATANLGAGKIKDSIIYAEMMCNNAILCGTTDQLPRNAWNLAYPKAYYKYVSQYSSEFGIDESLVLAVIREESRFNPKTLSWANARGLMQIIPQTGLGVARLVGIRQYRTSKLFEEDTNIRMGCYYLASLLKRFNYNIPYAVAAYNGGPIRVKKWINAWNARVGGDIDLDEFVESIPLSETRRYVQKVMKSYYEYKRLYTSKYPRLIKG